MARAGRMKGAKYRVPIRRCSNGQMGYVLEGELLEKFAEHYATHWTRDTAKVFGMAHSTANKLAKRYGLKKDPEAIRKVWSEWCHTIQVEFKADKERHGRFCEQRSAQQKQSMAKDRLCVELGLPRRYKYHLPFAKYTRKQTTARHYMKVRNGYVPGNMLDESDRWNIYYTAETVRSVRMERHAEVLHFRVKPLGVKETVVPEARAGVYFEIQE